MSEHDDARHQTYANLESLWLSGNPQVLPVSGSPWCEIRLDPEAGQISLRTAYQTPEPDLTKLRNLSFVAIVEGGAEVGVIEANADDNVIGVYGLISAIADGLQLEALDLAVAVNVAVDQYKDVVSQRSAISEQVEVGLFGELVFVRHLVNRIGPSAAIDSWLGPMSEEHDFVLPGVHVEVKTTTSERRQHMISGLSQLVPVPEIPLALLSIQVTRATPNTGTTLSEMIAAIRRLIGAKSVDFDAKLSRQGWTVEDADLYRSAWVLRSAPRAYWIDDHFPAITLARISDVVPNIGLVSNVSYKVDLTNIENAPLPEPFGGFGSPEEE